MPPVPYKSSEEVAEIIKSPDKKAGTDYVIIDVRDDDFIGGNIVGATNIPSRQFRSEVDRLVSKAKDVPLVIFHCALSQERGPKAARIYRETRDNIIEGTPKQEVFVLRDGFTQFSTRYKDDPALVENWDAKVWAEDWAEETW